MQRVKQFGIVRRDVPVWVFDVRCVLAVYFRRDGPISITRRRFFFSGIAIGWSFSEKDWRKSSWTFPTIGCTNTTRVFLQRSSCLFSLFAIVNNSTLRHGFLFIHIYMWCDTYAVNIWDTEMTEISFINHRMFASFAINYLMKRALNKTVS